LQALDFAGVSGLRFSEWQAPFSRHLTGLTWVQLPRCSLQAIPPCVASLSTLKYLNVSYNSLHGLPVAPYLSCLEALWVAYCEITAFPLEVISKATALTRLHINGNDFEWTEDANEAVKNIETVAR
jgi:Leucine-rich repeat (LRR) protein